MSAISIEAIPRPTRPPGSLAATFNIARRVVRKYFRTPSLLVMGIVQSALFLFMFRYVLGGSIHAGATKYVEYLSRAMSGRSCASPAEQLPSEWRKTEPKA